MSELEIQTLIAKVSADIERQTEVLRGLERDKKLLYRRLNAVRDPVAKLPLEISAEIFLHCVDGYPVTPESAPWLLLHVCHAWTEIAAATPALWTELDLHLRRLEVFPELLQNWLQWTRNCPLKISLKGYVGPRVASAIWLHSQKLTSLHVHFTGVTVDEYYDDGYYKAVGDLDTLPQEPLFCLRELTFVGRTDIEFSWCSIFQVLRICPNLVNLDFQSMPLIRRLDIPNDLEPVLLPSLRRFGSDGRLAKYLQYITAPRLETLTFRSVQDPCDENILSFLRRSSPPVRVLELESSYISDPDFARFPEFFALLPTVDHLKLRNWAIDRAAQLIRILPLRVPNLRTLELFYDDFSHPASDPKWNMLVTSLGGCRGSRIQSIRLTVARGLVGAKENTRAAFRELGAGGMDVRVVDDEGQDLLSA
ncbi:hypothetical protein FB45DRAFT_1050035 [Roridomyces roridus]|uniref:F-box domain-containing protein n=1 Tax=Roridomyces roridus TaxID=1738132 RepID=A0AAD7CI99_9AGAR|nr:hypothetical protein FB45DRAFT_1050035 [Roridomyces roridus]